MSTTTQTPEQMGHADYFSVPGLSCSGMVDLAVSPLRFWYLHVNPQRPVEEPTPQMIFGSALHCAVLEPGRFEARYARELEPPEGALRTMEDLRDFLKQNVVTPKGTRKAEIVAQVQAFFPNVPILDVLEAEHAELHEGKVMLSGEDWQRVNRAADALRREPRIAEILRRDGEAEVAKFVTDPETGVHLKARMDWLTIAETLDLKTFTVKRGKSVDRAVADAIWYEQYYRTAYFYSLLRALDCGNTSASGPQTAPQFILAFVESEEPHEVRIRALRPKTGGQANLYWERARIECRQLINLYADCVREFGENAWRAEQDVTPLYDEDLPGLAY